MSYTLFTRRNHRLCIFLHFPPHLYFFGGHGHNFDIRSRINAPRSFFPFTESISLSLSLRNVISHVGHRLYPQQPEGVVVHRPHGHQEVDLGLDGGQHVGGGGVLEHAVAVVVPAAAGVDLRPNFAADIRSTFGSYPRPVIEENPYCIVTAVPTAQGWLDSMFCLLEL